MSAADEWPYEQQAEEKREGVYDWRHRQDRNRWQGNEYFAPSDTQRAILDRLDSLITDDVLPEPVRNWQIAQLERDENGRLTVEETAADWCYLSHGVPDHNVLALPYDDDSPSAEILIAYVPDARVQFENQVSQEPVIRFGGGYRLTKEIPLKDFLRRLGITRADCLAALCAAEQAEEPDYFSDPDQPQNLDDEMTRGREWWLRFVRPHLLGRPMPPEDAA